MASSFEELKRKMEAEADLRFKRSLEETKARQARGEFKSAIEKAVYESSQEREKAKSKEKQSRPAKNLKQSNPKDLRNKALREANKLASESAKASKAKTPNRALVATGNNKGGVPARVQKVRGNPNLARPPESIRMGGTGGTGRALTVAKETAKTTAKTTAKVGLRGLLGVGSVVVGMVTESRPAGSAAERAWERRNTEQRRMKGKVGGMSFTKATQPSPKGGGPRSRQSNQFPSMTAGGGPKSRQGNQFPSLAAGGGPKSRQGNQFPTMKKAKSGVNQFDIAAQNAKDKKKAGATTGATPAPATAKAKPKRKTNLDRMRRRQAERFAISSSGRPL
jgi:hypothetical protein